MKKIRTSFFLIILTFMAVTTPALAVTTATTAAQTKVSPSPSVTPPTEAQTTENLKNRIDTVLKSRTQQVKGVIDEMTLHKRGFVAEVERVIEKTVTVKNAKGSEVLVVDPEVVVVVKDNKKATIDDIAVGDWVIALGYTDTKTDNPTFTLRRLVVSSTSLMPKTYETVIGNVKTLTPTQLTFSNNASPDTITYQLNKNTKYEDDQAKTLKRTDIKVDSQYLVISYTDQNQKIATLIKSLATTPTTQK